VSLVSLMLLPTMGLACGSDSDDRAACNKLDVIDHPNAIVRFKQGVFKLGTTAEVDQAAKPLRTLDFRVADTQFAPDPDGPKEHLAAYLRFSNDANAADLTGFLANARDQEAVMEAKPGNCPLING
jgi:hypothetical protein